MDEGHKNKISKQYQAEQVHKNNNLFSIHEPGKTDSLTIKVGWHSFKEYFRTMMSPLLCSTTLTEVNVYFSS